MKSKTKAGIYDDLKFFGIYQEEYDNILKSFRVKRKITKEDVEKYEVVGFNVGDEVLANPIPNTTEEAFSLLTNYYAAIQCVVCKDRGLKVYKIWNKYSLEEEKYRLKQFIDEANNARFWFPNLSDSPINVYKNLINGYYRNSKLTDLPDLENATPARVYGEYVLYYEWIKAELRSLDNNGSELTSSDKQQAKKGNEENTPETFDELFNEELRVKIPECIRLLQETDPPIINSDLVYIGKVKGEIIAWFKALDAQNFIFSPKPNDTIIVKLLENKFKGFSSDASAFRKHQKRSENKYSAKFRADLLRIRKNMS